MYIYIYIWFDHPKWAAHPFSLKKLVKQMENQHFHQKACKTHGKPTDSFKKLVTQKGKPTFSYNQSFG